MSAVIADINGAEDAVRSWHQLLVPWRLRELVLNMVYLLGGARVLYADLLGTDANDGACMDS